MTVTMTETWRTPWWSMGTVGVYHVTALEPPLFPKTEQKIRKNYASVGLTCAKHKYLFLSL